MKVLAIIFVSALLATGGLAQTAKPKTAVKPKPAAAKSSDNKKPGVTAKPKTGDNKAKSPVKKPKLDTSAKATNLKPKTAVKKNNPIAPNPDSAGQKTKTAAAKPKPKPVKVEPVDSAQADAEQEAAYEKASTLSDATERIDALKKFIGAYPAAKRVTDAVGMIVTVKTQLGNDHLAAGDIAGAVAFYKTAIADASKPVPDQLFADTLAKIPANLYFRGARTEGFEIAKAIEDKADTSVSQMLTVATFYISVENGSEARRVAERAIKLDPVSGAAYQTLGLASRIDFLLEESAAAYGTALEIEPESAGARRGLAEMKRALGKSDDAVALYQEIIAKDADDLPARTGLVLALFDAGKRPEAEAELTRELLANPGNIILQAGAAYWYAAHNEGEKAVDLAQKAIANDPRFIWSHIALARGYIAQKNPVSAEKVLLAARRYGNFPTLEYEIAAARVAAGFYREAAEELAKSFTVKDGVISTNLGGRVNRGSKNLAELIGFERQASIFAPTSGDSVEDAARLTALLALKQELDKTLPNAVAVNTVVDAFVEGNDKMKIHRLVFAGTQLLEKNTDLPKVIELTKLAPMSLDAGLDVADPAAAVMASELYESRTIAAARGGYLNVPVVLRPTLSAVLRGRVEEISGWAHYQLDDPAQASIHLKRAVSVLPVESAWWRSSTWRLGTSLAVEGKNAEALEMYIRSYKGSPPDALRYSQIEALYKRINGHTLGLEGRIGPNPSASPSETVAQRPTPLPAIPRVIATPVPAPVIPPVSEPLAGTQGVKNTNTAFERLKATLEPSPTPVPTETPQVKVEEPVPSPTTVTTPEPSPTPSPDPTPIVEEAKTIAIPTPEPSPEPTPQASATPASTNEPSQTAVAKESASTRLTDNTNGLFPPVIINIPQPVTRPSTRTEPTPKPSETVSNPNSSPTPVEEKAAPNTVPQNTPVPVDGRPRLIEGVPTRNADIKPCTLTLDQEAISVQSSGIERAVVVRRTDDGDTDDLTALSISPQDVSIRREPLPGVKWTALFVLRSESSKLGVFQIKFESPCGKKEVVVRVQ